MTDVVALDAMGGDHAPAIVMKGASLFLKQQPGSLRFLVFGDANKIEDMIKRHRRLAEACELRHTEDFVKGDAKPSVALRQGRKSSMRLAIEAVKSGEAAAAVSAGNTGALMAMAKVVLRTLPGVNRPALASVLPARDRPVMILDLGANVQCDAEDLFGFAIMGTVAARTRLGVQQPRVALLNIGTEEMKGDDVVRAAATMLRQSDLPIEFAGFVEGNDVVTGAVDVVITDGFTGNVALKITEGTAQVFSNALKDVFKSSLAAKIGYLLASRSLKQFRTKFDPRQYNGAMFLGVAGVVVKSHGGTDAFGFSNALRVAAELVRQGANDRIIEEMKSVHRTLDRSPEAAAS